MSKHTMGIYEKYIKRMQDLILAILAIIITSPAMALISIIIYFKLGAPIFFSQERPGLNGKVFNLYKFRSMSNEKDENGELLPDHKRINKFGKMIRESSLDELPGLINIIKGDMSIVGPRPLLVKYLDRYNEHQARRHEVRPGLTGYAQVNGRNAISWEEKFDYDVKYVDNITFCNDWAIIFKTALTVLKREGINANNSVTMEEFMGTEEVH